MTATNLTGFDVTATYVHLPDGGNATAVDRTPGFWSELASGERHYDGRMMTASHMAGDMDHWEMHPAGEEVLISVSVTAVAVLQGDGGEERTTLAPGTACIVPRGVWHRILVAEPGTLVFVTPGEGTRHKPL